MVEERITYHRRRAEQEVLLAEQATDCSVVHAHYELSCLHFDAVNHLEAERTSTDDGNFMLKKRRTEIESDFVGMSVASPINASDDAFAPQPRSSLTG